MKIGLLSSLVLASVLSLSAFGCAAKSDDSATGGDEQQVHTTTPREVKASAEPRFASLGGVWGVRGVDNKANIDLSIIEAGGGDPALNGDQLFLSAFGPDHGAGGVYELGLNVSLLKSVEMVDNSTIKLTGTYDDIDANSGDIKTGNPFEALVKLTMVGNNIQKDITVTRAGNTEKVTATADEGFGFFSSLFEVKQKETKSGTIVRLFDTGKGGDPAMNGGQLVLSLMSFPEEKTYDLGLNVLDVKSFEVPSETEIRIGGTENFMNANGEIKTRPFAYKIEFKIGTDGAPAEAIKVTRTN